jgi:hypothetical protein
MLAYLLVLAALVAAAPVERASRSPALVYIHPKSQPTKCLSALKGGRGGYANTALNVRDCVGTPDQQFKIDGTISFPAAIEDLCVNTSSGESQSYKAYPDGQSAAVDLTDGRDAMLRTCPTYPEVNGVWDFSDGVHFCLTGSNSCLDLRDGQTAVQQWTCFPGELRGFYAADSRQHEPGVVRRREGRAVLGVSRRTPQPAGISSRLHSVHSKRL